MIRAAGSRLGPYELIALLGSGGMGEVYRARDTRLQRDVAIKVLPAPSTLDTAARERFRREARAVAALNHPHICALYDVGVDDSVDFLVMELVEGTTLAERLASTGPIAVPEALAIAIAIADAVDAAHSSGIVHRDLKPRNVMLTKSGPKILDFGLAKRVSTPGVEGSAARLEALPTTAADISVQGQIVGTLPYMAPEQILGGSVDARTDIFAFGVMLYEMLAGRRPFDGDSTQRIMAAILERPADSLPTAARGVPPAVDRVVQKCLAKDASARWQTVRDLADQLRWIRDDLARHEVPSVSSRRAIVVAVALVTVAAVVAGSLGWLSQRETELAPVVRFTPDTSDLDTSGQSLLEISPDGRHFVFVARPKAGGPARLFLHDFAAGSTRSLPSTDGATHPFWSGDGRSIAFAAGNELKRLDLPDGESRSIAMIPQPFLGGAWNRGGVIVVSNRFGLYRMSSDGGPQIQVTALDRSRQENSHRWPYFLPDGQRVLFVARSGRPAQSSAYLGYLDGRAPARLSQAVALVRYAEHHLFFMRGTTLMVQAFDADAPRLVGDPVSVVDGVGMDATALRARFSVAARGSLVYQKYDRPQFKLAWYDRTGRPLDPLGESADIEDFSLSPDGKTVAMGIDDPVRGGRSVWLMDAGTGALVRQTFGESDDWLPIWSRDGRFILFGSYRNGPLDLVKKSVNGSTPDAVVFASEIQKVPTDWSSDSRTALVSESTAERLQDVIALTLASGARTAIAQSRANETDGRFSPDDRWVAYSSDESGRREVYVQPFPPTGAKWQVSTDGGLSPHWGQDSRELYYMDLQRRIKAVAVDANSSFRYRQPVVLFQASAAAISGSYEVTGDGQRFLIREVAEGPNLVLPIHVILNWPSLLPAQK